MESFINNVLSYITFLASIVCTVEGIWSHEHRSLFMWTALVLFFSACIFGENEKVLIAKGR